MSIQLHPGIENMDKSSLCYSIYSQLYQNFFDAQDRKDEEHPFGIVEGDDTSLRLKNAAYGFASAIAGGVEPGEGGGASLDCLKKSGGSMRGILRANNGFEAGVENTRVLSIYAEELVNESGEVTGQNFGVRITGDFHVGGRHFYLDGHRVLGYDGVERRFFFDTSQIDFGVAALHSTGEIIVGDSREKGILITPTLLQVAGKGVYHAGNANLETVDWTMLNAFVGGRLEVTGEVTLSGALQALSGVNLGDNGKTVLSISGDKTALMGYLSFATGYGIQIEGVPVLLRATQKEIQLGSIGGDLLLGSEHTTKIRLLSGISDTNGDYILVSGSGEGYFPGSLRVRHNRGADLFSSYRVDTEDEGMIVHKRLRFGTAEGGYLSGVESGILFSSKVISDTEEGRIIQACSSRMEHCLSSSLYQVQDRNSYTLYIGTDTDFIKAGVPLEAVGHVGIDGSYTRLTDGILFFSEDSRLQAINGGIKHYGNSVFRGNLSSEMFSSGFAGSGWGILQNRTTGGITATFDEVTARRKLRAYEFEVVKFSATNGSLWVSDSCSGDSVEKL